MRALIIREPWVSLITEGKKTWELRSRNTKIRGKIGLIRGGSGLIVGTADLINVVELTPKEMEKYVKKHGVSVPQLREFSKGRTKLYAWVLENARAFTRPKKYDHPSGAVIWVKIPK